MLLSRMPNFSLKVINSPSFRPDGDKNGGGQMIFFREGLIAKGLYSYKDKTSETVCLEIKIS